MSSNFKIFNSSNAYFCSGCKEMLKSDTLRMEMMLFTPFALDPSVILRALHILKPVRKEQLQRVSETASRLFEWVTNIIQLYRSGPQHIPNDDEEEELEPLPVKHFGLRSEGCAKINFVVIQ